MNGAKLKAVGFIVVFLLALALLVNGAMKWDDGRRAPAEEPEQTQEQPAEEPENTPEPEQPAQQQQQQPTVPTVPTPKPEQPAQQQQQQQQPPAQQQTVPTPVPTQPPMPTGQTLGSGSFHSETGTGLNLICDWTAVSVEGNKAEVTITVSCESYSLYLSEMGDNIFLRVGDQPAQMAQPQLSIEGGYTVTNFGSRTFTLPLSEGSNNFSVAVEWHFNGSYSGVPLEVIECGTTITLTR